MRSHRTEQPISEVLPKGRMSAGVMVVPGLPDYRSPKTDKPVYPPNVADLVKLLREKEIPVAFADDGERAFLGLKAAEVWLPIVVTTHEILVAGLGVVMGDVFRQLIGYAKGNRPKLHVRIGKIRDGSATVEWMTATGEADDVLAAVEIFLGSD